MKKNTLTKAVLLGAVVGLLAQSSYGTVSFQSALTTVGGADVNATADISISGSTMTVTLTDLLANPESVANILNGIQINISSVTSVSGLTANNGTYVDIAGDKTYTTGSLSGATIAGAYALSGGSTITLTALGGGQPAYLIIGPAGYDAANGSIAGNDPHNPFILGSATFQFTLSGPGSFSENDISGVTFLFGTGSDYSTTTKTAVPEPATVVAGALLLLPLGVSAVRILRRNRTA